jgi:anti-anti-sigma regulatory factor
MGIPLIDEGRNPGDASTDSAAPNGIAGLRGSGLSSDETLFSSTSLPRYPMSGNEINVVDTDAAPVSTAHSGQLRTVISGTLARRVIHADGQLSETGCRSLMAFTEELVRNGCTSVRLDLSGVTVVDIACLRSLRQFRAILQAMGVDLGFNEPCRRPLDREAARRPVPATRTATPARGMMSPSSTQSS